MLYLTEYLHRNKIKLTASKVFQFVFLYTFAYIAENLKIGIKYFVAHVLRSWPCYLF